MCIGRHAKGIHNTLISLPPPSQRLPWLENRWVYISPFMNIKFIFSFFFFLRRFDVVCMNFVIFWKIFHQTNWFLVVFILFGRRREMMMMLGHIFRGVVCGIYIFRESDSTALDKDTQRRLSSLFIDRCVSSERAKQRRPLFMLLCVDRRRRRLQPNQIKQSPIRQERIKWK